MGTLPPSTILAGVWDLLRFWCAEGFGVVVGCREYLGSCGTQYVLMVIEDMSHGHDSLQGN